MQILYRDDTIIAINKPEGMLVHKTDLANDVDAQFAVQMLRDHIGQRVNPVHRLDRPTSGILLFTLDSETTRLLKEKFDNRSIEKEYHAVVRGFCPDHGEINEPLKKENGTLQDAQTLFTTIGQAELPFQTSKFETSRYSLVKVHPKTGRMHQIRRHFAKARNYMIGDTTHGDLKQNRAFAAFTGASGLMLHASKLTFTHPHSGELITISSELPARFTKILPYFK